MKLIKISIFSCFISFLLSMNCCSKDGKSIEPEQLMNDYHYGLPVFSSVSGFGLDAKGGTDGTIIKVTNLNNTGSGSLLDAIQYDGPRIIVFEVAGVIDLELNSLQVRNPFITIAGQTAPYPGITLIQGGIKVLTHDVIIQHLKIRPGEAGQNKKSGWEVDGLSTGGGAYNVIIDHCSMSWATDENLSASGPRFNGNNVDEWRENTSHKIVFSNCIIAEALSNSTHSKGEHSKGSLIHDNATEILLIGNLFANNMRRSPYCKGGSQVAILNNFISNPGAAAIHFNLIPDEWSGKDWATGKLTVKGNSIEFGKDTRTNVYGGLLYGPLEVFWEDNLVANSEDRTVKGDYIALESAPLWPKGLEILPAKDVKNAVLKNAGAFPWARDEIDNRIIAEVIAGTGKIIDSEKEVGGYPTITPVYREFNVSDWNFSTLTRKTNK